MKISKIIFMLVIASLLMSCQEMIHNQASRQADDYLMAKAAGHTLYYPTDGRWDHLTNEEEISDWMFRNVKSKSEPEGEDTWNDPEITLRDGGNCKNLVMLYQNMCFVILGKSLDLVAIYEPRIVAKGGDSNHAVVQLEDGRLIDPKTFYEWDNDICYIIPFEHIF